VYHVLVKNAQHDHETEEARRRRRARGWRPSAPATPGPDEYFGHLTVSDADYVADTFQTYTTDDDFCEVIVEPRKEPPIDDKQAVPTSAAGNVSSTTISREGPNDDSDLRHRQNGTKESSTATHKASSMTTNHEDAMTTETLEEEDVE
jgi:hypothetical protein